MRGLRRVAAGVGLGLFILAGCTATGSLHQRAEPAADIAEVLSRYNAQALGVERVAGTTAAFVRFRDPDTGDMRREVGEGHFVFVRPSRVALTIGKLGHDILWAGNNDRLFWLFDLQEEGTAYVGSYARLDQPGTQTLPLPVRSDRLPGLIGLIPVDPQAVDVEWHDGLLLVEPHADARRLLLDARTGRARRIDLLDANGRSRIICELTGEKPVRRGGDAPSAAMAAEAAIRVVGEAGDLTIKFANLTDEAGKFDERLFDFDALRRKHKPAIVVELDEVEEQEQTRTPR